LKEVLTDKELALHYRKLSKRRADFYSKDKVKTMWKELIEEDAM